MYRKTKSPSLVYKPTHLELTDNGVGQARSANGKLDCYDFVYLFSIVCMDFFSISD